MIHDYRERESTQNAGIQCFYYIVGFKMTEIWLKTSIPKKAAHTLYLLEILIPYIFTDNPEP